MARLPRSPIERQSVLNRSMLGLAGGGRSAVVSPEPRPLPTLPTTSEVVVRPYMVFGGGKKDSAVILAESAAYELREDGPLGVWAVLLDTAGSTTTTLHVNVNGSSVGSVNLTSGTSRVELDLSAVWGAVGERVSVETTAAGTGALGLSVMAPIA